MKIAILVWGSLFWDPRNLETTGEWFYDGPSIPIEFARISGDGRLTLVIKNGVDYVTTLYTISTYQTLADARSNLQNREGTNTIDNIGFIDFIENTNCVRPANEFVLDIFKTWNENKDFDAIIWSDFSPRFRDKLQKDFTIENVRTYLNSLSDIEKTTAVNYIRKAPTQIQTSYRKDLEQHFE